MRNRIVLFLLFFPGASSTIVAQIYVFSGAHKSYVRNEVLTGESPVYSWHVGGGINLYPKLSWPKTSVNAEVAVIRKGYNQQAGNQKFEFRFQYITWQGTLKHNFLPFFSLQGGLNLALLVDTNIDKWTKTYQFFDVGLMGGLTFLENKRISFYTRVVYGLLPMLKYYEIDGIGNFNGRISDLKNTCFMVGLLVNVYEKKISIGK